MVEQEEKGGPLSDRASLCLSVVASSVAADAEASVRRAGIKLDRRRKVGAESGMQVMSRIGANLVAGARARMDMRAPYSTGGANFSVLQQQQQQQQGDGLL